MPALAQSHHVAALLYSHPSSSHHDLAFHSAAFASKHIYTWRLSFGNFWKQFSPPQDLAFSAAGAPHGTAPPTPNSIDGSSTKINWNHHKTFERKSWIQWLSDKQQPPGSSASLSLRRSNIPFKTRAAVAEVFAALSQHRSKPFVLAAPITRHIAQRCHLSTVLL
jgi:hypothetical protein